MNMSSLHWSTKWMVESFTYEENSRGAAMLGVKLKCLIGNCLKCEYPRSIDLEKFQIWQSKT